MTRGWFSNEEEDGRDKEAVTNWAKCHEERIMKIRNMIDGGANRSGLDPDLVDALREIVQSLKSMERGELPEDHWNFELFRELDETEAAFRETLVYGIEVSSEGISASSYGTSFGPGKGSRSRTVSRFEFPVFDDSEESGDWAGFSREFEAAITNGNFEMRVEFNHEPASGLTIEVDQESTAERAASEITYSVISDLKQMGHTLSGEDSGLENVWDEICVQVQVDESLDWEVYLQTIDGMIAGFLEGLSPSIARQIWQLTDEAADEGFDEDDSLHEVPYCLDDLLGMLRGRVLGVAGGYSNFRIIRYRNR